MILKLDWEKRVVEIRVEGEDQLVQKQMPFANAECDAVKYLLLYKHTGHALSCGCESLWCRNLFLVQAQKYYYHDFWFSSQGAT